MKRNVQRRNRWLSIWLLACIMTLGGTNAWAQTWSYNASDGTITDGTTILKVTVAGQELTITDNSTRQLTTPSLLLPPDGVVGGYTITAINDGALGNCKFTEISLPSTVKKVGGSAFVKCELLETINLEGVTSIGIQAFKYCKALKEVTLNSGLTILEEGIFEESGLTKISISASVKTMSNYAFWKCVDLKTVTIDSGSELTTIGEFAFSESGLEKIEIPGSVETLGKEAFSKCAALTTVTFHEGLTEIGKSAFWESGLTSISIPNSVKKIDDKAFLECAALEKVLGSGLTTVGATSAIGNSAFMNCTALKEVTLNEGLESIGTSAFLGVGIKSISLPNTVKTLGQEAFMGCTALTTLTIGALVKNIDMDTFGQCNALDTVTYKGVEPPTISRAFTLNHPTRKVYLPNGDPTKAWNEYSWGIQDKDHFIFPGGWIFDSAQKTLSYKVAGTTTIVLKNVTEGNAKELKIGDNSDFTGDKLDLTGTIKKTDETDSYTIVGIGANAFKNNAKLTSLTLPATVTSIEENAFAGMTAIEALHLLCEDSTKITLGDISLDKKCVVYIPKDKLTTGLFHVEDANAGTYKNWNDFTYILPEGGEMVNISYKDKDGKKWPYSENSISAQSFLAKKAPAGQMFHYVLKHANADSTIVVKGAGTSPTAFAYQNDSVKLNTTTETLWGLTVSYMAPIEENQSSEIVIKSDDTFNKDGNPEDNAYNGTIKDTQTGKLTIGTQGETQTINITLNNVEVTGDGSTTEILTDTEVTLNLKGTNALSALTNNGTLILTKADPNATLDAEITNAGILFMDSTGIVQAVKGEANLAITTISDQTVETGSTVKLEAKATVTDNSGSAITKYTWFKKNTDDWTEVKSGAPTPVTPVAPNAFNLRDAAAPADAAHELTVASANASDYRCEITAENADASIVTTLTLFAKVTANTPDPDPANYSVTLPKIEGATTDPEAGIHWVTEGENWKFSLKLDSAYSQSTPIVKANDKVIEPNTDGFYMINWIYENQIITVTGIVKNTPVGNAEVEGNNAKVWSADGALRIHTPQPARVRVVSFSGSVYKDLGIVNGDASVMAPRGSYIVIVGNETFKIAF